MPRVTTGEPRRRRSLKWAGALVGVCLALWVAGLLWFAGKLPDPESGDRRTTDAIVVLTGGSGRLQQGLELLARKRARKLFVSGVYRGVDVKELLQISQQSPEDLACCVALGYEAVNTAENALETAAWMRQENLSSLRLVTSAYHMPRSLLEFRQVMPDIEIVPNPVSADRFRRPGAWLRPRNASLLAGEYSKYLVAAARVALRRAFRGLLREALR